HQDLPFERLVEILNPPRTLTHHPLFQTMLILQNNTHHHTTLGDARSTVLPVDVESAKFDLSVFVHDVGSGELAGSVKYATDIFDRDTIERFSGAFVQLLHVVADRPHLSLSEANVLSVDELQKVLSDGKGRVSLFPPATLPELLSAQASRTPDATALIFEGDRLSYAELDSRSSRLAHALVAKGVGPECIVAVSIPRSLELLITLCAILKAGGAYMPIDLSYPDDRIRFMIHDADPALVITRETYEDLTSNLPLAAVKSEHADAGSLHPHHPAYVIYTSGSTGRPKGVVVPHSGIVNRLRWMQDQYQLEAEDRVLQKTPSGFDVSVWEFFWPLLVGATEVIAKPDAHRDPSYLTSLIKRERVTTVHFVPSMLDEFLGSSLARECTTLRRVICSGEALSAESARRFHQTLGAELHNLYGPTEASVDVTYWHARPSDDGVMVPIGKPISSTQVFVLDGRLGVVPPGVVGELYVAGAGRSLIPI
uniref:non-ribosomal peptide synthetase n=1 Tax=Streptomyces sp. SBT349 TaxID=1580539 RepID=UPI00066ECD57